MNIMRVVRTNKICEMRGTEITSNSIWASYKRTNLIQQPNAIIEFYFKNKIAKKYGIEEKIKLMDYISELALYYPQKNSIEVISTAMTLRWQNEEKDSRKWEFDDYVSYIFEEHSDNADELMSYILGDKWEIFQKKIELRPKKMKEYARKMIEGEMEKLNEPSYLEKEIEKYKDLSVK